MPLLKNDLIEKNEDFWLTDIIESHGKDIKHRIEQAWTEDHVFLSNSYACIQCSQTTVFHQCLFFITLLKTYLSYLWSIYSLTINIQVQYRYIQYWETSMKQLIQLILHYKQSKLCGHQTMKLLHLLNISFQTVDQHLLL